MGILVKHIVINLRENKFRSIILILTIAIMSCFMYTSFVLSDGITEKYVSTIRNLYGDCDLRVSEKKLALFHPNEVKMEYIKRVDTFEGTVKVNEEGFQYAYLVGIHPEEANLANFIPDQNILSLSKEEVAIAKKDADFYGLEVGNYVSINDASGVGHSLKIALILEEEGYVSANINACMVVVNYETADELFDIDDMVSYAYYDLDNSSIEDIYQQLMTEESEQFNFVKLVDMDALEKAISSLSAMFWILFFFLLLLLFFVISSIMKLIMQKRLPALATFQSIGASQSVIVFLLIMENVLLGIVGCTIGNVIGWGVSDRVLTMFFRSTVKVAAQSFSIHLNYIGLTYFVTILLELIMVAPVIHKISTKTLKELLFEQNETKDSRVITSVIGILFILFAVVLFMTQKKPQFMIVLLELLLVLLGGSFITPLITNFFSYLAELVCEITHRLKIKHASINIRENDINVTNIQLFTVITTILMLLFLSVRAYLSYFGAFDEAFKADIIVSNITISKDDCDLILQTEDVIDANYLYINSAQYGTSEKEKSIVCLAESDSTHMNDFYTGLIDSNNLLPNLADHQILVDEKFALQEDIRIGDTMKLHFEDGSNQEFEVKGLCDVSSVVQDSGAILMNFEDYLNIFSDVPYYMFLNVAKDSKIETIRNHFPDSLSDISWKEDFIEENMQSNKAFAKLATYIFLLGGIISLLCIFNHQVISMQQRKKELAILSTTSMSQKQMISMMLWENVMSLGISWINSICFGRFLYIILQRFLKENTIHLKGTVQLWNIAGVTICIFIFILLVNYEIMIHMMRKFDALKEIRRD